MSLITIGPCSKMYTWATISNLWTNKSAVRVLGPLERLERQEFGPQGCLADIGELIELTLQGLFFFKDFYFSLKS
jgi:hypothetical protein